MSRESMLAKIRSALQTPIPQTNEVAPQTVISEEASIVHKQLIDLFVERVRDYRAVVLRAKETTVSEQIRTICSERNIRSIVIPSGIPATWIPQEITLRQDDASLTARELDHFGAVITRCAVGIAETGTIVLDGAEGQGRRMLSLVPDVHICIIQTSQIVDDVPNAIAALQDHPTRPMTFISGPSATSDIELNRVEGVHGPRSLYVIVIDENYEL